MRRFLSNYFDLLFYERVTDIWNSLPSDVVDFSLIASFKRSINSVDFSKYLDD